MNCRSMLSFLAALPFVGVLFGKAQAESMNTLIGAKAGAQITTGGHAIAIGGMRPPSPPTCAQSTRSRRRSK